MPEEIQDFSVILPKRQIAETVREWVDADIPSFDVGALVVSKETMGRATLYMKSPGVFAGKPFFEAVFDSLGCTYEWSTEHSTEGLHLDPSRLSADGRLALCTIHGPVVQILQGERTALNTLSRCSGVATTARSAVDRVRPIWNGWVAGTRKTTPGSFRLVEKYGLLVGGASTHRIDLSQMVMIKDNHIAAANGSISTAVQRARAAAGFSQKIEVECNSLAQARTAAEAGADIVMLDNFAPDQLRRDATLFKEEFPHVLVEASGGITEETMEKYVCGAVDIISQGKLTHGYECIDYSLKID